MLLLLKLQLLLWLLGYVSALNNMLLTKTKQ